MHRFLTACLVVIGLSVPLIGAGEAADDSYTVNGIKVDASAQSTVEAQTQAINAGRDRAWQTLYRRLTKEQDWARQPPVDPATLQRLVRSYQVHNARSSTTRFVAEVTYVFNANAVRKILQQAEIAYADTAARPILVIPMAPAWSAQTPWTRAWADPRFSHAGVPLILPLADAVDGPALAALQFDSATWPDIEPIASRVHAAEAYVVLVIPQHAQMLVKIRRLGAGASHPIADLAIPVPPKTPPGKAFASVADATARAITESWKAMSVVDFGKRSKLVASLHVNSIDDWGETLQKLGAVAAITDVNVVAMDIGEARLAISYLGSSDQLTEQLGREGLDLTDENGIWWLAPAASTTVNK